MDETRHRPIRVLIADDHPLVTAAARRALEDTGEFEIVASVTRGSEVVPCVSERLPDVLLLDLNMPELDGLRCLERVRERWPDLRVVIFSASSDARLVTAAQQRGANGFVLKSVAGAGLSAALRSALTSSDFQVYGDDADQANADQFAGLSDRELLMLRTLASGLSNKAIGHKLWITEQTVKFHLTNIYRKLGVENRTQAIRYAYAHGLVEPSK